MRILDAKGKQVDEVNVRMSKDEITELLVAASQIDDGSKDYGTIHDPDGTTLGIFVDKGDPSPLERHTDWWVGPLVLFVVLLTLIGAFTIARGIVELIF